MNCKEANKNLIFYADRTLSGDKEKDLSEHLNTCRECSVLLSKISGAYETLEIKEDIEPKAFFTENVLNRISEEVIKKEIFYNSPLFENMFSRYFRDLIYSAALILVVLVTIFYLSEGSFPFFSENDNFSAGDETIIYLDN